MIKLLRANGVTTYDDGDLHMTLLPLPTPVAVQKEPTPEEVAFRKQQEYEATLFYSAGGT